MAERPFDDERLSARRRQHVGRALARAKWVFDDAFDRRIRERGFTDFRPADVEVLARLPVDGARVTELATRSRVSKQAIGKLVQGLVDRGYVERRADPDDGRAKRVALTARGRLLLEAAMDEIAEIEAEWTSVVGAGELLRIRRALLAIADAAGPEEYL